MTRAHGGSQQGGVLDGALGDDLGEKIPTRYSPMMELGGTGLRRASGYVDEEFLPALRGPKGVKVFREMGDNDPIAGALLFALQRLIGEVSWSVVPASDSSEDRQNAEFLEQCRDDMRHSWSSFVIEALSCLQYGWSWHEMCFKKRLGPWYRNQANNDLHRSQFDDGRIGWARLAPRSQESLLRWSFWPNGDVRALVQMPAPTYETKVVPYAKSLLFNPSAPRGNPEGFSVLRRAYRPWYMKKRIEEYEAIGIERDLAGLPMGRVPADILNAKPNTPQATQLQAWKKLVQNIRRDEQDGILVPSDTDAQGKPQYEFSLLQSGGSRQMDTNGVIERYAQWMLMQVLADFIYVGHNSTGTGTYNMHTDKSGLFKTACQSFAQSIEDELNRQAVPVLFAVNGVKPMKLPKFKVGQVDAPDLTQLVQFLTGTSQLGIQWFPDPKMEAFVRNAADLPEMDKADEKAAEQAKRQQRILTQAQTQLQGLQLKQQAVMGQQQMEQGELQTQQAAVGAASSAAEFVKPGSTQPPPPPGSAGGATRPPAKKAAGKPAGRSNAPKKAPAKSKAKAGAK